MNAIVLFISQLFFYVVFVCRFVLLKLRYDGTFNGPVLAQTYSTKNFRLKGSYLKIFDNNDGLNENKFCF